MTTFTDTLAEAGLFAGSADMRFSVSHLTVSEVINAPWIEGALLPAYGLSVAGGGSVFNFSASQAARTWIAGAAISEACGLGGSLGVNQVLKQILAQQFGLTDLLVAGIPVTVAQSMNIAQSLTTVLGALIAERLQLVDTNAPQLTYKQTLLEYLYLHDGLAKFLAMSLMENVNVAPTYSAVGVGIRSASESVNIAQVITPKLIAIATVPESVLLSSANVLQAIFKPIVSEALSFDIGIVEPAGGFTTWTVNTRTGATTEYSNYAFNSFAQSGHHYLGASSNGLYVLDGDDDDGTPTVATLRSGYAQFGGSRYSSIKAAYLGIHGSGDVYLKIDDSTGGSTTYQVKLQNYQSTKVRTGKGLRTRYIAWELVTSGQDFDLDSVEFVPLIAQRRV